MPQTIDVPGHGLVEFPDSMDDTAVVAAIQKNLPPSTQGDYGAEDAPPLSTERQSDIADFLDVAPDQHTSESLWEVANKTPQWAKDAIDAVTPDGSTVRNMDVSGIGNIMGKLIGKEKINQFLGGAAKEVGDLAKGFITPLGVSTLGLGAAPRAIQKVAGVLFALNIAKNSPDTLNAIRSAKTPQEYGHAITSAVAQAGMVGAIGAHLASPAEIAPATAKAVEATPSLPDFPPYRETKKVTTTGEVPTPEMEARQMLGNMNLRTEQKIIGKETAPLTTAAIAATELPHEHSSAVSDSSGSSQESDAQRQAESERTGQAQLREGLPAEGRDAEQLGQAAVGVEQDAAAPNLPSVDETKPANAEVRPAAAAPESDHPSTDQDAAGAGQPASAPGEVVGLRKSYIDRQRKAMGLPERMAPLRQTLGAAWDEAIRQIETDQGIGARLVTEMKDKPRALNPVEQAIFLHEQAMRETEHAASVDAVNDAKTPEARLAAQERLATARDAVQEAFDANQKFGTSAGRALQARTLAVDPDTWTLARMEAEVRALKSEDAPLTDKELKDVKELHDKLKAAQDRIAELESNAAKSSANQTFKQVMREMGKSVRTAAKEGKSLVDYLHEQRDAARKRLGGTQFNSGIDPAQFFNHVIIGASYIADGVVAVAEFAKKMVAEFGEKIRPAIPELFEKSKAYHDATEKAFKKTPSTKMAEVKSPTVSKEDPLNHRTIYDLARAHINAGVHGFDDVMAAVLKDVQAVDPTATLRDIHQAFSEYGKVQFPSKEADKMELSELRNIARLQESIDRLTEGMDALKTGPQRNKATQAIREKQAQLNELLRKRPVTDSPEKLASANQARVTALKNQIADLDKRLQTGEPGEKTKAPETPQIERLRAERNAMRALVDQLEAEPKKSPEQRYNETRSKQIAKRTAELQARIAANDYSPTAKPVPKQLSPENIKALGDYERLKDQWLNEKKKIEMANRSTAEKAADWFLKWRRMALISGFKVLGKLTVAGQARFLTNAADSAAGRALGMLPYVRQIAARSPRGRTSVSTLARGYVDGWMDTINQAKNVLRTGKTDVEASAKTPQYDQSFLDYVGNLHALLKLPAFSQEYRISLADRTEHAMRNGIDMTDPVNQLRISNEAVQDGLRAKFGQENALTKLFNVALGFLKKQKNHQTTYTTLAKLLEFAMPIRHIPSNFFTESATYANLGLGLPRALAKTMKAFREGIDTLKPEEAESVMRHFNKGAIGAGMLLLGYYLRDEVGGYYQPGKRDEEKPQFGGIRLLGHNVPRYLVHMPLMEPLHLGATVGHVLDKMRSKNEVSVPDAIMAGAAGLLDENPYAQTARSITQAFEGPEARRKLVVDSTIPATLREVAEAGDQNNGQTVKRKPRNLGEQFKTSLPGLRQQVPER